VPFASTPPQKHWRVTWSFVLRPEASNTTRLYVRARAEFTRDAALRAAWIRPAHYLMEKAQLHNLRARVEGTLARDDWHDVLTGLGGAARIGLELIVPFRRELHSHWGLDASVANRRFPGDELVPQPRWSWTHGIEIAAPAADVWPWMAQIGAKHAGFYSYQWLENVLGCELRNAESIHPEWQVALGDDFFMHPAMPPLKVAALERGHWFAVHASSEHATDKPRVAVSWLFQVEPLAARRCRMISRYRVAYSHDLLTRLSFGPGLLQSTGFALDRRMLLGIRRRAEHAEQLERAGAQPAHQRSSSRPVM
jgi:hypothetical protein